MNSPISGVLGAEAGVLNHSVGKSRGRARAKRGLFQAFALVLSFVSILMLITLLAALHVDFSEPAPMLSLRSMDSMPGDAGTSAPPPPPPPAQSSEPELIPELPDLPKLSLDLNNTNAPAIKAQVGKTIDFQMVRGDFSMEGRHGVQGAIGGQQGGGFGGQGLGDGTMSFMAADLDSQPRLVNRPSVPYPAAQRRRGVNEGKVTLEVLINSAGRVTVRRVISSSHEDFTVMARTFATRARFTPPKKEGRPVNAIFQWPLILKP